MGKGLNGRFEGSKPFKAIDLSFIKKKYVKIA